MCIEMEVKIIGKNDVVKSILVAVKLLLMSFFVVAVKV